MTRIPTLLEEYNRTQREPGEPFMTQRRLAELAGVNEATLHRHLTGKTGMSLEQAAAYARVLRCTIEELLDDGDAERGAA